MIDELATFPATLKDSLAAAGPHLRIRASDGRFAMVEHLCHLDDLEREAYGARIARLLSEEKPEWDDFDGAAIAEERKYLEQDADVEVSLRDVAEMMLEHDRGHAGDIAQLLRELGR